MRKTCTISLCLYIFVIYALPAGTSGAKVDDDLDREPLILELKKNGESFALIESYHLLTDETVLERAAKPNQTFPFQQLVFACPMEEKDRKMLTDPTMSTAPQYGNVEYCLFDKEFPAAENKRCASPLPPELNGYLGEKRTPCGAKHVDSRTYIYTVAFKYCQSLTKVIQPATTEPTGLRRHLTNPFQRKPEVENVSQPDIFKMYDICYNSTKKTPVWVRYTILAPTLIEDEPITDDSDISTETFSLLDADDNYYEDMKLAFDNQNQEYQMVPQLLVPKEDLARHSWRTAALYYFSVAPLWSELKPLMDAINRTIRKLASRVKKRTGKEIDIYTTTYNVFPTYMDNVKKRFLIPDIWVKLVRYPHAWPNNESVLIYLHNTPANPDKIPKQCDQQIPCDFGKWSATAFTEEQMKYLYCCKTTKEVLEKSFPNVISTNTEDLLDIDEWLREFHPLAVTVPVNASPVIAFHYPYQLVDEANTLEDGTSAYVPQFYEQLIYLCPAEKVIRRFFEHESTKYDTQSQCLFKKHFEFDEPKKCENQVKPALSEIKYVDGPVSPCSAKRGRLYHVGYRVCSDKNSYGLTLPDPRQGQWMILKIFIGKFCGTLEYLVDEFKHRKWEENYCPKVMFIESYTICYNPDDLNVNKTMSTIHSIKSLKNYTEHPNYNNIEDQLNVGPFRPNFHHEVFKMMRQIYKAQKEDDPNYMVPHPMVPRKDKLSEHWWQITAHYANTAPLWGELVPLMNLIEERIRKLADEIEPLLIYTKIFSTKDSDAKTLTCANTTEKISVPEFWSKLVMWKIRSEYRGVAIYVRNTPGNIPKNRLCQRTVLCNFKSWFEESSVSPNIPDHIFEYAYCCALDDYTTELFPVNRFVRRDLFLDLNALKLNEEIIYSKPGKGNELSSAFP